MSEVTSSRLWDTIIDRSWNEVFNTTSAWQAKNKVDPQLDRTPRPSSDSSPLQLRAFGVDTDASKVLPSMQKKEINLKVPGLSAFKVFPTQKGMCYYTCVEMMKAYFRTHPEIKDPTLQGVQNAIQVSTGEDPKGRIFTEPGKTKLAQDYIDRSLEKGCPLIVGVSYRVTGINSDRVTDHYVIIDKRGYDPQGRLYYEFKDPDGGGVGRFYQDQQNGILFKPKDPSGYYVRSQYAEMSQVRTYVNIK